MSTISEIFKKYNKKIDAMDLELIISAVIKKPREFVLAHPEYEIVESQKVHKVKSQIKKRIGGEPLAYILGEKEFYGLNFKVNKNVLVPRPETEMIIDHITHNMEHITWGVKQKIVFMDVGTGSGCIIIALAKLFKDLKIKKLKDFEFVGIDISKSALRIARQNAKFHKVSKEIKFFHGNLLEPIIKKIHPVKYGVAVAKQFNGVKNEKFLIHNSKFLILANLPYLTPSQIKSSPSIKHEPKLALSAGHDGLKYYRQLFKQIKKIKKILCVMCYVLCEVDPSQTSKIKKMIKTNFSASKIHPVKSSRNFAGGISRNAKSFNRVKIYPAESRPKGGAQSAFSGVKKDLRGLNRLVIVET